MNDLVHRRHDQARTLLRAGDFEAATSHGLWLWSHALEIEPSYYGVRLSYLASDLTTLCRRHAPARVAFVALRDALPTPPLDVETTPDVFGDWVTLHEILDERDVVRSWFERATFSFSDRAAGNLEGCIGALLVQEGRWAELARLYPSPSRELALQVSTCKRMRELDAERDDGAEARASTERYVTRAPRALAGRLARALRAAGRDDELPALVSVALAWDAGPEMHRALAAGTERSSPRIAAAREGAPPHTWFSVDRVPGDRATTAWKRLAREHQARWRLARGYPIGTHPHGDPFATPVGSRLELGFAQDTERNLLTPAARASVHARVAIHEAGEMFETTRLWADLLSSMPFCFNLFGDLAQDRALARKAVDSWWPRAPAGDVALRFEHSPGRGDPTLLGNRSAFDVAFDITQHDGTHAIIGVETKYHEHTKREKAPTPTALARCTHITERSGAFVDGWREALVGTDLQQIWLDHLLVLAMLQHPSGRWAWGRFVVVAPAANPSIASAVERYRAVLRDDATFGWLSLEEMLGEGSPLLAETRVLLAERYLPGLIA